MEFVVEFVTGASGASARGVSALSHEVGDYPMECHAVIESRPSQEHKVVHGLRSLVSEQFDLNFAALFKLDDRVVGGVRVDVHRRFGSPLQLDARR